MVNGMRTGGEKDVHVRKAALHEAGHFVVAKVPEKFGEELFKI